MRTIKAIAVPLLAIAVSCAMIVGAVSIMRLSDVVENVNTVTELPVSVSILPTMNTPGTDLPNYTAGMVVVDKSYDMVVNYTSSLTIYSPAIVVKFSSDTDIDTTSLTMQWATNETAWVDVTWDDTGGIITGTFGAIASVSPNTPLDYYLNLTYKEPGDYTFKLWVEGSLTP